MKRAGFVSVTAWNRPEVLLFGSMLTDSETVSDVDVAVGLAAKTDVPVRFEAWVNERIQAAVAGGRRFSSFVDQIGWPRQKVMGFLMERSPVLSLTTDPRGDPVEDALRAPGSSLVTPRRGSEVPGSSQGH